MTSKTKTRIANAAIYAVVGAAVVLFLVSTPSWLQYVAIGILAGPFVALVFVALVVALVVVFGGAMALGALEGIHRRRAHNRRAHNATQSPPDQDDFDLFTRSSGDGEGGGIR